MRKWSGHWQGLMLGASVVLSAPLQAEMAELADSELSEVDGAGVGLVLESFLFEHGDDNNPDGRIFKIGGIQSSTGEAVEISVSQLYIGRSGSDYGATLNPVNLGRLTNPYKIDVIDGNTVGINNKAVVEISAPTQLAVTTQVQQDRDLDGQPDPQREFDGQPIVDVDGNPVPTTFGANPEGFDCLTGAAGMGTCVSRLPMDDLENGERPDFGMKLQLAVGDNDADSLSIHAKSAVFDGSRLRLWGDDNRLVGEIKLNLYTPELTISACEDGGGNCGNEIKMHNFVMELALGNALQPMHLGVNYDPNDPSASGHLVFEIKSIRDSAAERFDVDPASIPSQLGWIAGGGGTRTAAPNKAMWDYFNDYYENPDYRSNIYIGKLEVSSPAGAVVDFGSSRVEGMLIQYMNITTHDLAPPTP